MALTRSSPLDLSVLGYLAVAHLANDLLTGLVPAVLPLLEAAFHVSYAALGAVVLVSNVTSSMTQPLFGLLSDRRPLPWLMPLGPLLAGAGLLTIAHAPSYGWVVAAVGLSGLGSAAFHPEASRAARLAASAGAMGTAQAIFQVGGNLGFALAPLMLPLLLLRTGRAGLELFFLLGLALALVWLPVRGRLAEGLRSLGRPAKALRRTPRPAGQVFPLVLLNLVVAMRSFVQLGLLSFLPLYYAHRLRAGAAYGETLAFFFLLAGAVGTYVGGVVSDRIGPVRVVQVSLLLSVPLLFLFPRLGGPVLPALDVTLLGFFVLCTFAVTVVLGQQYLPGRLAMVSGRRPPKPPEATSRQAPYTAAAPRARSSPTTTSPASAPGEPTRIGQRTTVPGGRSRAMNWWRSTPAKRTLPA